MKEEIEISMDGKSTVKIKNPLMTKKSSPKRHAFITSMKEESLGDYTELSDCFEIKMEKDAEKMGGTFSFDIAKIRKYLAYELSDSVDYQADYPNLIPMLDYMMRLIEREITDNVVWGAQYMLRDAVKGFLMPRIAIPQFKKLMKKLKISVKEGNEEEGIVRDYILEKDGNQAIAWISILKPDLPIKYLKKSAITIFIVLYDLSSALKILNIKTVLKPSIIKFIDSETGENLTELEYEMDKIDIIYD